MRITGQMHGDTSSLEFETRAAEPAPASPLARSIDASSFTGRCEDSGTLVGSSPVGEGPESGKGSRQTRSVRNASRRPVARARVWLVALFVDSFATCGEAMYPGLVVSGEIIDGERLERSSLPRWQAQDQHETAAPWLNASRPQTSEDSGRSAGTQPASAGWRGRITSRVTRFWSTMRRNRQAWLTATALEALDDRTLKDIGLHRSHIESVAWYRDRYHW
jgi:uncharacterized protein YjiS (DUF1127 family)